MRILEIILVSLLVISFFGPRIRKGPWTDWLSIGTVGVAGLHLWLEGYRWQMLLIYGIVVVMGMIAVRNLTFSKKARSEARKESNLKKVLGILGAFTLLVVATLPPILLPVPKIRRPSGPYQIGTITVMLVDESRQELYSGVAGQPRRLMVQIWYPAEPETNAKTVPWVEEIDVIAPAISEFLGFPHWFLNHLKYAKSNAYKDAPVAKAVDRYPVLLFSHGWDGFRAQNTFQVEELASHGYVVAAPDHTYGAVATVFPDGEVVFINHQALHSEAGLPEDQFNAAAHLLGDQWAGDLSFILDSLENPQPGSGLETLEGRLDFERVGALGHSTGGGAAIQFCGQDGRCKIVLGMDPYMKPVAPSVLETGLDHPLMGMFSEARSFRSGDNLDQFNQLQNNSSGPVFRLEILGSAHYDFSDLPAFSPLAHALGLKGAIRGQRALKIISDYTLAFFGNYLMGLDTNLLDGPTAAYPEVFWKQP
jgi:predicted dienelactone hydrolase